MDQHIINFGDPGWNEERIRNPKEDYENFISLPRDADYTDEEYELKLNHLREFKDWFEKQNY
jgi:hypothetical protein